jgi:hypothetical protein
MRSLPRVPWQITGNHWVTLPCIHPGDASIHSISVVHAQSRGAIEFATSMDYLDGDAQPLIRFLLSRGSERRAPGSGGIAWSREAGWMPAFSCKDGDLSIRGVICAPHGANADLAGAVIEITVENRGMSPADIGVTAEGTFGKRLLRVRSAREFDGESRAVPGRNDSVILEGAGANHPVAIAVGGAARGSVHCSHSIWSVEQTMSVAPGRSETVHFLIAAGQERDGAEAVLEVMRRRGPQNLVANTRATLLAMEPATGNAAADRLIARHMFFTYFCSVARAIDDAHLYVVRSRIPWNEHGLTIRDWHALMWVMPAVQLADSALARELLLRICDLHGYAPGSGVHYLDGSLFEPGFSLDGAAAFPIAVDEYIVHSGDDKVVEEPLLADSLYNAADDIAARKHERLPLYSTEVNPDGSPPEFPYTAHGNTVAALALQILAHTLDEKTAEKVQDAAAVRAAVLRHFSGVDQSQKAVLVRASSLGAADENVEGPSAAMYWLPYYDLLDRDDSIYRRTVKPLENAETDALFTWCARLLGPSGSRALDWLRRASLDGGLAAEQVDSDGRATGNGGDAALSGLVAYTAWYAVHALGVTLTSRS